MLVSKVLRKIARSFFVAPAGSTCAHGPLIASEEPSSSVASRASLKPEDWIFVRSSGETATFFFISEKFPVGFTLDSLGLCC